LLAVIAASASYYLVEQPMIRLRERWGQRRKVVAMATAA
jgi:peptidoglycan/LPS O-acetylase OafA/YrhL